MLCLHGAAGTRQGDLWAVNCEHITFNEEVNALAGWLTESFVLPLFLDRPDPCVGWDRLEWAVVHVYMLWCGMVC